MSVRDSLRGMHRLIRVDTLRRVHNVFLLVERLNSSEKADTILPYHKP